MTAPTPSPSPDTDVDMADVEEEDDEVMEEEEEEEEEIDEEEVEEEEAVAVKDPDEYEYPIDSGLYQTPEYLDSYYEKSHKPTTSTLLMKGDGCKDSSFVILLLACKKSWSTVCVK